MVVELEKAQKACSLLQFYKEHNFPLRLETPTCAQNLIVIAPHFFTSLGSLTLKSNSLGPITVSTLISTSATSTEAMTQENENVLTNSPNRDSSLHFIHEGAMFFIVHAVFLPNSIKL